MALHLRGRRRLPLEAFPVATIVVAQYGELNSSRVDETAVHTQRKRCERVSDTLQHWRRESSLPKGSGLFT